MSVVRELLRVYKGFPYNKAFSNVQTFLDILNDAVANLNDTVANLRLF